MEWVAGSRASSAEARRRAQRSRPRGTPVRPLCRRAERAEFRHSVPMTSDTLLDVVRTRSRLVAEEDDRREIDRGVSELVSGLPEQFELPYVAVAFRAEVLR